MRDPSDDGSPDLPDGAPRLEPETVRQILRRAAEKQARMESERIDSYTLEELEEAAKEAGISPTALRAAAAEHGVGVDPDAGRPVLLADTRPPASWLSTLENRMPASWSQGTKRGVLAAVAATLVAALLLIPGAASAAYLAAGAALILLLIGLIAFLLFFV